MTFPSCEMSTPEPTSPNLVSCPSCALLRLEGAEVVGVADGYDALRIFRGRHFDVVISDLGLSDIPGDVLIRTIIARLDVPLRWLSSQVKAPSLTRALEAGAGAIFAKPCEWRNVVAYLDGLGVASAT
jgi:DNA-binding response OmpR family regulator